MARGRRRCSWREQRVQGKGRQQGRYQPCSFPFERNSQHIHGIRKVIGRERIFQLRVRGEGSTRGVFDQLGFPFDFFSWIGRMAASFFEERISVFSQDGELTRR